MIGIINNKYNSGFRMTFVNGLTISVQIGGGNYCSNRLFGMDEKFSSDEMNNCDNAEIAIWNQDNVWYNFDLDVVIGWIPTDQVAQWIFAVQTATSIDGIKRP